MPDTRRILLLILAVVGLSTADGLAASEGDAYAGAVLDDEFFVLLGGFFPTINSQVRVDSSSGIPGTGLDFEDQLGLAETAASPYLYFRWRYHPVHRIELEYYELLRNGTNVIGSSFRIGDVSGNAGVSIFTKFDVKIGRITYGYDIIKDRKKEWGILAGAHLTAVDAKFSLSGNLTIDGVGSVSGTTAEQKASIAFPLPHVGTFFAYNVTPEITTQLDLLLFRIEVAGIKGTLTEANATIHFQVAKHVGIGTGLKYYHFRLEDTDFSSRDSRFDFDFFGPVLYGSLSF